MNIMFKMLFTYVVDVGRGTSVEASSRPAEVSESFFDKVLDRSVVPGYTNIGFHARRRHWPARLGSLHGCRALITGAGSGLGEAAALGLARLGATVHLLGRSADRVAPARDRISAILAAEGIDPRLHVEECDVSDLSSVRAFAASLNDRLARQGHALDILVHNAGTMPARRQESVDGHELTLATHVLGPVLMTDLLLPSLARSAAGARVIVVTSGGMYAQAVPVEDPEYLRSSYRGATAYARSKRIQVEISSSWADRLAPHRTAVHTMHPGWADTPGVATSLPMFRTLTRPLLRNSAQGADTIVWLAATELDLPSGRFWHDRAPRPTSYRAATIPSAQQREKMWEWVLDAVGLTSEPSARTVEP